MEYSNTVEYDEKKDPGQAGVHDVELARTESDDVKETKEHLFDGNYDPAAVVRTPSAMDDEIEEDSPYPEVRAAVSNMDDPTMQVNTWRVWFLGMFWAIIMAGVNQFFFFRYPNIVIPAIIAQLLSFPMGKFLARVMPNKWGLNPGPFNVKEHVLITIMASVSYQSAYATDIIAVQRFFYNQTADNGWGYGYQIMLVISTQMIGFCLGGLYRKMLVWPSAMIWPSTLVNTALFNTLHSVEDESARETRSRTMSREKYFVVATGASFVWSWFPNYLASFLAYFDWVTWIAPNNQKVNMLFGYQHGMGMSLLTFDWGIISGIGNPMATPWWATANILGGFVFFIWFLYPIMYYQNVLDWAYLPFSSSTSFDRYGKKYNVSRIMNDDATFNEKAYEDYSPLMLSATYALSFAALSATITHTILYYRKQIWSQFRKSIHDKDDIHMKLMSRYPEIPLWWYGAVFLVNLALGIAAIHAWPTGMPVWALFLALAIAIVLALPIGMIQAITNQQVGLNVITELIIGFAVPGKPVSMMIFKTYGYITMAQGMSFISDMKIGHYMKVPPRLMFFGQCSATAVAAITQIFVQAWVFSNIDGICDTSTDIWWCPSTQTFGTASIIWGAIGPQRTFGKGQLYAQFNWFWLIGAVVPIPTYFLAKRYPKSFWRYVNWPVIFSGVLLMPPYLPINFLSYCYVGFLTQYLWRRRHFSSWQSRNYVLSAAISAGYALAILAIFFCLQYPKNGEIGLNTIQSWWGNIVYNNVIDAQVLGSAHFQLEKGGHFGPEAGTWH
ncbi:hypothetical protein QFC20_005892 [Naganishia adeliensis]|uniref:Uncharacterized protein n=1 Tax=Naganishia adeliensis TaxID=92952 RepID=A0ACC2VIE4_9TREE|nr:hypothetical protein QFC20_005892 [Naganishia adeliensis]